MYVRVPVRVCVRVYNVCAYACASAVGVEGVNTKVMQNCT